MPLIYRVREINDSKNSVKNRVKGVVLSAMKSSGRYTVHEPKDIPSNNDSTVGALALLMKYR